MLLFRGWKSWGLTFIPHHSFVCNFFVLSFWLLSLAPAAFTLYKWFQACRWRKEANFSQILFLSKCMLSKLDWFSCTPLFGFKWLHFFFFFGKNKRMTLYHCFALVFFSNFKKPFELRPRFLTAHKEWKTWPVQLECSQARNQTVADTRKVNCNA